MKKERDIFLLFSPLLCAGSCFLFCLLAISREPSSHDDVLKKGGDGRDPKLKPLREDKSVYVFLFNEDPRKDSGERREGGRLADILSSAIGEWGEEALET